MSRTPSFTVVDGFMWLSGLHGGEYSGQYGFATWEDGTVSVGPFHVGRIDREYGDHQVGSLTGGITAVGSETGVRQSGSINMGAAAKVYFALAQGENVLHVPEFHIVAEASAELRIADFFSKIEVFTRAKAPQLLQVANGALATGLQRLNTIFDAGLEFKGVLGVSVGFTSSNGQHHGWVRLSTMLTAEFKLFGLNDLIQRGVDSADLAGVSLPSAAVGGGRSWQLRMVDLPRLRLR